MSRRLQPERLPVQHRDAASLQVDGLVRLFTEEPELPRNAPVGICRTDPRSGERIVFSTARAGRPHDNRPDLPEPPERPCIVCRGQLTAAVDVAPLSDGFTFINKNLYPMLWPDGAAPAPPLAEAARGLHFLQWTSSVHDHDFHNMPVADCEVVLHRLARLERVLLQTGGPLPDNAPWGDQGTRGFVAIMKNHGRLVGGSLAHGHQQIVLSSVMPRRFAENLRFQTRRGERYADFILRENPPELTVCDLGEAVLLVPYFMRRPYDLQLVLRRTDRRYLHQLTHAERLAVARGWQAGLRAIRRVMPELGRELAYNVVTCSGPGAGLYFELLPYTQETGGYEQLGLVLCQADPLEVAEHLRALIASFETT